MVGILARNCKKLKADFRARAQNEQMTRDHARGPTVVCAVLGRIAAPSPLNIRISYEQSGDARMSSARSEIASRRDGK